MTTRILPAVGDADAARWLTALPGRLPEAKSAACVSAGNRSYTLDEDK
ncbi:hypothetical protein ACFQVC_13405 [Streptomyces monticola]|uniref:Uncharacterized protein n=1 Tax=Streptomyces monticola TaxID=2666263 RepID=A0ABW2JIE4_9ACTN